MAQLVVRDLAEDVKERLRRRAKQHGRSLEAEVRDVLEAAARSIDTQLPASGMGTELAAEMAKHPVDEETWLEFERLLAEDRASRRSRPVEFE